MQSLNRSFYEAAVHVLPVFLLPMGVGELRLRAQKRGGIISFICPFLVMAWMVFAELTAFAGVSGGDRSPGDAAVVITGLMLGCAFLLIQFALVLGDEAIGEHSRLSALVPLLVAVIAALTVFGGAVLIYLEATLAGVSTDGIQRAL